MKTLNPLLLITALLCSCGNQATNTHNDASNSDKNQPVSQQQVPDPKTYTDTLQFIHFEGNYDYFYCVFLNAKKDTVNLVTDSVIPFQLKNRLFEVKWFTDTLFEAGDNDSKYAANRMAEFRLVPGKAFVEPITEVEVLQSIKDLPEVQSGADQAGIAERPADGKDYYLIETGTREPDNFSRFLMFKVYTYPKYRITVYDPGSDTETELEDWRKNH